MSLDIDTLKLITDDYKDNICIDYSDEDFINSLSEEIVFIYFNIFNQNSQDKLFYKKILKMVKELLLVVNTPLVKPLVKPLVYTEEEIETLTNQILELKKIKQPEQRTPEWHTFRNNRLTASDLGTALGKNKYSNRKTLIAKKCGHEVPFIQGDAITHGVKYEDVAINIYERRNNVNIHEYGCIPHPTLEYFGASPDGICNFDSENRNYIGRMLEIKCPKSRPITGIIPEHYELQVQGQLDVCDLLYCDYLECSIKEYKDVYEFMTDTYIEDNGNTEPNTEPNTESNTEPNINRTKDNKEKGVIVELYDTIKNKNVYIYLYNFNSLEEIQKWEEQEIEKIYDNDIYEYIGTTYWYLEKYSCVLVLRDIERFEKIKVDIKLFWDDVLKYREIGYESLITKKKREKKKVNTKELLFLPDSS